MLAQREGDVLLDGHGIEEGGALEENGDLLADAGKLALGDVLRDREEAGAPPDLEPLRARREQSLAAVHIGHERGGHSLKQSNTAAKQYKSSDDND